MRLMGGSYDWPTHPSAVLYRATPTTPTNTIPGRRSRRPPCLRPTLAPPRHGEAGPTGTASLIIMYSSSAGGPRSFVSARMMMSGAARVADWSRCAGGHKIRHNYWFSSMSNPPAVASQLLILRLIYRHYSHFSIFTLTTVCAISLSF